MRKLLMTLCVAGLACGAYAVEYPPKLQEALAKLDTALDSRNSYESVRRSRLDHLEQLLEEGNNMRLEQKYQLVKSLYEEYYAYQFDKALSYLQQNMQIARELNDPEKIDETNIQLGYLYAASGFYLESDEILNRQVDETRLSPELRLKFYIAQQKLNNELINYSKLDPIVARSTGRARYYTDRLLEELPKDSFDYQTLYIVNKLSQWQLDEAEKMCLEVIENTSEASSDYALATYLEAVLCNMTGRIDEMAYWYAQSAMADIHCGVKDNASLYCLSTYLFGQQDVMRALRYIRISMDDATFYNAKLRQWQIATYMTTIEESAQTIEARRISQMRSFSLAILILAFCLLAAMIYLFILYRQSHRDKQMLRDRHQEITDYNRRLSEMNHAVIEANHVKEEYIGLFLTMCSSYIDKLSNYQRDIRRKLSRGQIAQLQQEADQPELVENELKSFYEMFDNVFLHLYPSFVEDFNGLLLDKERITPHKDERLTTELRIFALIRLGITDSSKIAAMLHYSVNTIYNYRAKVKNKAKYQRDNFEEAVRHIGSFNA